LRRSPFGLILLLFAGVVLLATAATPAAAQTHARPVTPASPTIDDGLAPVDGLSGTGLSTQHAAASGDGVLLGGDQISDGSILCSVGFNVVKDGQDYVLTAGHCTAGMPYWENLGPSTQSDFPTTDYGLIRDDSYAGAGAVNLYNNTVQPITGVGNATVGEHVCASGQATQVTCGKVIAVNQTVDYGDGNVVHGLIETDIHTDHGDSGGPLFDGSTALGTVSGGDGQTDFFQPLAPALAAFGAQLVTAGYPAP
jgi:streptogrisin D